MHKNANVQYSNKYIFYIKNNFSQKLHQQKKLVNILISLVFTRNGLLSRLYPDILDILV